MHDWQINFQGVTRTIKKLLVVNLGGVGDIILSFPLIRSIKKGYASVHISYLAFSFTSGILEGIREVDRVVSLPPFSAKEIHRIFLILYKLRKEKFDLALNPRTIEDKFGALSAACLFHFVSPHLRAGRNTEGRGNFYHISLPERDQEGIHEVEYDKRLLQLVGIDKKVNSIRLELGNYPSRMMRRFSLEKKHFIAVSPGTNWPSKRWPEEGFVTVINYLQDKRWHIVLLGSQKDRKVCESIERRVKAPLLNLAGKIAVMEAAGVVRHARMVLTNDTGMSHIAAAVGTPEVVIFGPGDVARYHPWTAANNVIILHDPPPCAPCFRVSCRSMECLKRISPDTVIAAIEKLL
jgi:lipopolysaccharide heptosyltransferase II